MAGLGDDVFFPGHDGLRWARVDVSGTVKKPQQDLASQVIGQIGHHPGAVFALGFKGISWYVGNWFGAAEGLAAPARRHRGREHAVSIRIGIGSWADDDYRGILYPPKPPRQGSPAPLRHGLRSREINSTYYGAPKPDTVKKWIGETPAGFLFDIKLHRVFSQSPRSAQPTEGKRDLLGYTLERLEPLIAAQKLGVFLLLLTDRFGPAKHSLAELDVLAERLRPFRMGVELRDPAWVEGKAKAATLKGFRDRGLALVNVDMPRGPEFFSRLG